MKVKSTVFLILTTILPSIMYLYGIYKLVFLGDIINRYHLIVFVAFPLFWFLLSALFAYGVKRKIAKWLYVIALVPLTWLALILLLFINREMIVHLDGTAFFEDEQEITAEFKYMPKTEEMGEFEKLDYYHFVEINTLLFISDVHTIICQYGEEEYEAQKAYIEENYVFETEDYRDYSRENEEHYFSPTAEIDGFTFRYLDSSNYEYFYYPKYMVFIGTNDQTHEIAYIDFYDIDLDYLPSLDEFITGDCGWEHVSNIREGINARFAIFVDLWRWAVNGLAK